MTDTDTQKLDEHALFIRAARDFYDAGPDKFTPGYDQYGDLLDAAERLAARITALDRPAGEGEVWGQYHVMLLRLINAIHGDSGEKTQAIGLALSYQQAFSSPAIAALDRPAGEGWQLVQVEPTEAMLEAGLAQWSNLRDIWSAMLSAAYSNEVKAPEDYRLVPVKLTEEMLSKSAEKHDHMLLMQAAKWVTDGFRCRTCDVIFLGEEGHPIPECEGPNWDILSAEDTATEIHKGAGVLLS